MYLPLTNAPKRVYLPFCIERSFPKLMNWTLFCHQLKKLTDTAVISLTGKNSPYESELLTAIKICGDTIVIAIQWRAGESIAVYQMTRESFASLVECVTTIHTSDIKIRLAFKNRAFDRQILESFIHTYLLACS